MDQDGRMRVICKDGTHGTIAAASIGDFAATHVLVQFETGVEAHVPAETLVVQAGQSYVYLALTMDELALPRNVAAANARGAADTL